MKAVVTLDIEEQRLKEMAQINDSEEALKRELGWVEQSGIYPEHQLIVPEDGPIYTKVTALMKEQMQNRR